MSCSEGDSNSTFSNTSNGNYSYGPSPPVPIATRPKRNVQGFWDEYEEDEDSHNMATIRHTAALFSAAIEKKGLADVEVLLFDETSNVEDASDDFDELTADQVSKLFITVFCSAQVLKLASDVFSAELSFPGTRRSQDGKRLLLVKDEDDAEAMLDLLMAMHLQHRFVPKCIPFGLLYQIAVACDKYECQNSVIIWIDLWMSAHMDMSEDSSGRWLFMAYALRHEHLFLAESLHWILGAELDNNGQLVLPGDQEAEYGLRDVYLNLIQERRKVTLETIARFLIRYTEDFVKSSTEGRIRCQKGQSRCDALNLGVLMQCALRLGLWPAVSLPIKYSVNYLMKEISVIERVLVCDYTCCCPVGERLVKQCEATVATTEGISLEEVFDKIRKSKARA